MWSGENWNVELVRFLLQPGADKSPKNNRGRTTVEIAERKGQKQMVKILKGGKCKKICGQSNFFIVLVYSPKSTA